MYFEDKEKNSTSYRSNSKNILIFSNKGGSGKSFLATNIAINLYKKTNKKVVLYDMDFENGNISLLLGIKPQNTIYDISLLKKNFNTDFLYNLLTYHDSGIRVLPAPENPAQAESIDFDLALKMFEILSMEFDYVIIDPPSRFSEEVLALLNKVDKLCIIASLDVPGIKSLKITLDLLALMKFPSEKIVTIMNRFNSKVGIDLSEVEVEISRKVDVFIPSNIIVPISVNKGSPVIESSPSSPITQSINKLTGIIINK